MPRQEPEHVSPGEHDAVCPHPSSRPVHRLADAGEPRAGRVAGFATGGLARGAAGGRRGAPLSHPDFERLYDAHAAGLLAFLVYRTGDRALAEDLLGDTFERVLRTKRRFDPRRGGEKTWLYAIALNCLRDHARRRAAEHRALERAGGPTEDRRPSGSADALHDRDLVRRSLEVLSDDERLVVALRYGADLTMPEIAKVIKEPLTTVEGRVYRALGKLRTEFDRAGG